MTPPAPPPPAQLLAPPPPPPPTTKYSTLNVPPITVKVPDEVKVWNTYPFDTIIVPPVARPPPTIPPVRCADPFTSKL